MEYSRINEEEMSPEEKVQKEAYKMFVRHHKSIKLISDTDGYKEIKEFFNRVIERNGYVYEDKRSKGLDTREENAETHLAINFLRFLTDIEEMDLED